jgi:hypothetical protein
VAGHLRERIGRHKLTYLFVQFCNLDSANGVGQCLDQIEPASLCERDRKLNL